MSEEQTEVVAARANSADAPWPVSELTVKISDYIKRLGAVWVEGELTKITDRGTSFFAELRDLQQEMVLPVHSWAAASLPKDLQNGDRVAVLVKPDFFKKNGKLSLTILEIRKVGLGELLERIQRLREQLTAEGLTAAERKQPLPFLPGCIGLITGKNTDAEKDVINNTLLRWPEAKFKTIHTKVQGDAAAPEIIAAIQALDADPEVEVIIIARGGGAFGDLLVFSDEKLVRTAAAAKTPIISAIGHDADRPVLDDVADWRASTPTDAAKRVVPDVVEERRRIGELMNRAAMRLTGFIDNQISVIAGLRSRPVLANPYTFIDLHEVEIADLVEGARDWLANYLDHQNKDVDHLRRLAVSLSPQSTLDRGYSVVRDAEGNVLRDASKIKSGTKLRLRLAKGETQATAD
jgi:exodeoxyribonuclease VII large subunit